MFYHYFIAQAHETVEQLKAMKRVELGTEPTCALVLVCGSILSNGITAEHLLVYGASLFIHSPTRWLDCLGSAAELAGIGERGLPFASRRHYGRWQWRGTEDVLPSY